MKPHEEEWDEFDDGEIGLKIRGTCRGIALFELDEDREPNWERARLAAQAPAMARWMLEWAKAMDAMNVNGEDTTFGSGLRSILRDAGVIP
jgi:hypothetical protein